MPFRLEDVCSVADGGLGLRDFRNHSQALCLARLVNAISDAKSKVFFLVKYFCGAQLASMRSCWSLRDHATPSAISPSTFYTPLLTILRDFRLPSSFSGSSKEFYSILLAQVSCIATSIWGTFCFSNFFFVSSLAASSGQFLSLIHI